MPKLSDKVQWCMIAEWRKLLNADDDEAARKRGPPAASSAAVNEANSETKKSLLAGDFQKKVNVSQSGILDTNAGVVKVRSVANDQKRQAGRGERPRNSNSSIVSSSQSDEMPLRKENLLMLDGNTNFFQQSTASCRLSSPRSSGSSNDDSALMAMAKRIRRLRAETSQNDSVTPIECPPAQFDAFNKRPMTTAAPMTNVSTLSTNATMPLSISDVSSSDTSLISFYRLPEAKRQTFNNNAMSKAEMTGTAEKMKIWSSEPVLNKNSASSVLLDSKDAERVKTLQSDQPICSSSRSHNVEPVPVDVNYSFSYNHSNNLEHRFLQLSSYYRPLARTRRKSGSKSSPFNDRASTIRSANDVDQKCAPVRSSSFGAMSEESVAVLDRKTRYSNTRNGSYSDSTPIPIPNLLNLVTSSDGTLNFNKLETVLRMERNSCQKRLEKEMAKREALEDVIVKINASSVTPRPVLSTSSLSSTTHRRKRWDRKNGLRAAMLSAEEHQHNNEKKQLKRDLLTRDSMSLDTSSLIADLAHRDLQAMNNATPSEKQMSAAATNKEQLRPVSSALASSERSSDDEIPMGGEAIGLSRSIGGEALSNKASTNGNSLKLNVKPWRSVDRFIDPEAIRLEELESPNNNETKREQRPPSYNRLLSQTNDAAQTQLAATTPIRTERSSVPTTARSGTAFFLPVNSMNAVDIGKSESLQDALFSRRKKFVENSYRRLNKIAAASSVRAELARRERTLAAHVVDGEINLEEANRQLKDIEPLPSAFSRLEMFRMSKQKYEQLPEIVARRNRVSRDRELATNRTMKLAHRRLVKMNSFPIAAPCKG